MPEDLPKDIEEASWYDFKVARWTLFEELVLGRGNNDQTN